MTHAIEFSIGRESQSQLISTTNILKINWGYCQKEKSIELMNSILKKYYWRQRFPRTCLYIHTKILYEEK